MGITITIQTYNRAEELRKTLLSLAAVGTGGAPEHEILVVDNNSSDQTAAVAGDLSGAFPGTLRYVREGRQGLSHARNRAVAEARHEIIAFLDDDVDVNVNWLRNLAAAYEAGDHAAVGGRALLVYPTARPGWLGERSEGLLTKVDYGLRARPAAPDELYGVNLSFRKAWLERVGGFRPDLGRVGHCLLGSEETDLLERIAGAGGTLLYEPAAVVGHRVPPARLRRRWFWARCYWGHRGEARRLPPRGLSSREFCRATWYLGRAQGAAALSALVHGPRSEEFFYRTQVLASRLGYWVGLVARFCRPQRPELAPQAACAGGAV
jgi:glycosyltransferase involved in cell wall biosynthesis